MADEAPPPLERIVEAMLFIGGAPLSPARACEAVRGLTAEQFQQAVSRLNRSYREQGRPYRILPRGDGLEIALRPDFHVVRERLQGSVREARLSQAAQDTLALVAYRQPIKRQEVEALRGGDSLSLLRQLVRLGLASVQRGSADQPEPVYSTTRRFLELMGVASLDDLPRADEA
jgi:segregation and condensation protein B